MKDIVDDKFIPLFLDYFKQSEKKKEDCKIGLEIELIGFRKSDNTRLALNDLLKVLQHFNNENDWEPVYENGVILEMRKHLSKISLEPGLQLEFSTNPHVHLKDVEQELTDFRNILAEVSGQNDWQWLCIGYDPFSKIDDIPWNPKKRYEIMKRYLPNFGQSVLRMMPGTAGSQVNLDYTDEADMTRKMAVSSAISIIIAAVFTNSCVSENSVDKPAIRSEIWNDIDPIRTGYVDIIFEKDFNYLKYIRYILDVPMLVLKKNGFIEDHAGKNFKDFLRLNGDRYDQDDWVTQLSVTFPFSRLRNTIEVRMTDSGNVEHNMAICAFWKGLLYHEDSLHKAFGEVNTYSMSVLNQIRAEMPQYGLNTVCGSFHVKEKAALFLNLAKEGLTVLAPDEVHYLSYMEQIISAGSSVAENIIAKNGKGPVKHFQDMAQTHGLIFNA